MSSCNALLRTPEDRRYVRRCQGAAGAFLALYVCCAQAGLHFGRTPLGYVLTGTAGAAFFGEVVAVGLLTMKRLDEFQRTLMAQSFLWATLITMFLAIVYGMIELHSHGALPQVNVFWVPMLLITVTALAKLLIFRRNRSVGE